jgi:hypothetical protein
MALRALDGNQIGRKLIHTACSHLSLPQAAIADGLPEE